MKQQIQKQVLYSVPKASFSTQTEEISPKKGKAVLSKNNVVSQMPERPSSQRMMRKTPDAVSFKLLRDANIYQISSGDSTFKRPVSPSTLNKLKLAASINQSQQSLGNKGRKSPLMKKQSLFNASGS
jgi:hypothetical protein